MARILITSGPTRQYLDPVRYLTNASSGRMGSALAQAAIELGHDVVVVSGPVQVEYPSQARVVNVITTQEMLDASCEVFRSSDGLIGAAAPCDYMPAHVQTHKLTKTGDGLHLAHRNSGYCRHTRCNETNSSMGRRICTRNGRCPISRDCQNGS
jgi:phosphopantothenoylcysteine decarboxylase / phosphopantothenate---cysteine ligase